MTYIRTKEGIGVFRKAGDGNNSNYDYVAFKEYACPYNGLDIIKQADTIEELCDELVLFDKDIGKRVLTDKGLFKRMNIKSKKALHIVNRYIYGAIWTDKGLIYVAKMNKEGELELL